MSYVSKPRIVIVGAGFAGLAAAEGLKHIPADVTVIDRQNHHLFQPLLYQVATAGLSPADIAWPVRHVLRRQANARVLMGEVTAVDPARRVVMLDAGPIAYDYLVLATGATHVHVDLLECGVVLFGVGRPGGRGQEQGASEREDGREEACFQRKTSWDSHCCWSLLTAAEGSGVPAIRAA